MNKIDSIRDQKTIKILTQKVDEQSTILILFQNKCSAVNLYDS